jgi:hypothetical protein
MNVRTFSLNISQKINQGNYETKAISIGAVAELDESDNIDQCKAELSKKLNQLLEQEIAKEKQALLVLSRH